MNKVLLVGIIGNKHESPNVVGLSVATKDYSFKDNTWIEETEWHNVKVFGKGIQQVEKYGKGDEVEVEGRIKTSKYKNQQGVEVVTKDIIAEKIKRTKKAVKKEEQVKHSVVLNKEDTQGDLPF